MKSTLVSNIPTQNTQYFDPLRPFIRWCEYSSWVNERLNTVLGGNIPPKLRGIFGTESENPLAFYHHKIHGYKKGITSARIFYPMNLFPYLVAQGKFYNAAFIDSLEIKEAIQRVNRVATQQELFDIYPHLYALNFDMDLNYNAYKFVQEINAEIRAFAIPNMTVVSDVEL